MTAYFKVGDLVSLRFPDRQWESRWNNDSDLVGKPLLVISTSQIAVGENVFNVYKAIHGTKTMSNLRAYDLDLFA